MDAEFNLAACLDWHGLGCVLRRCGYANCLFAEAIWLVSAEGKDTGDRDRVTHDVFVIAPQRL